MPLSIPTHHKAIIAKISRLGIEEQAALLGALDELTLAPLSPKRLTKDLASRSELSELESDELLSIIANLHALSISGIIDQKRVIPEVLEAIRSDEKLGAKRSHIVALRSFLGKALKLRRLKLFSKALSLYAGHQKLFSGAKIFTDLRPVFEDRVETPVGFIVSHVLRLAVYHDPGREPQDIYIALDRDDLDTLQEIIDRARKKQTALEKFIANSGTEVLAPKE